MLRQRIVTALVLLVIVVATLVPGNPLWFDALALVFITAAGWEWGRLNAAGPATPWLTAAVTAVICAAAAALALHSGPWDPRVTAVPCAAIGVAWLIIGPLLLRMGVARWGRLSSGSRLVGGVLALTGAWVAIALWRDTGVNTLLSALALVWAADIGAYTAGRRWGRHKLAPSISPGKTWEGFFGGWVAVIVLAVLWQVFDVLVAPDSPSIFTLYELAFGFPVMVAIVLLLTVMSVVGDLTESLVKRSAGMKDSSQLLPGHGGVLDRIDALLPTLPIAYGVLTFAPLAARPFGLGS